MDRSVETRARKRKQRIVLSCNDCRRRKLKCDRELPCNRCIHGGNSHKCAYSQDPEVVTTKKLGASPGTSANPGPIQLVKDRDNECTPSERAYTALEQAGTDKTDLLERRILSLEAQLSSLVSIPEVPSKPELPGLRPDAHTPNDRSTAQAGLFKGCDYRTFLYGPTSPISIVVQFPQLRPFMKSLYKNTSLQRLKEDLKSLEDRARVSKVPSKPLQISSLRVVLPDRITTDLIVRKYFSTFEKTYRILHVPTFWSAYETFWDDPATSKPEMDAIVLGILACTLCTSNHDNTRYDPNGSTFRSKAITWLKAIEAWLKRQSNKHRTLGSLQVRCLRILALMTTCYKTKEIYQESQTHLAFMRSCGMHRDPGMLGSRCSQFEGEMRRRLWATSLEFELQRSIDKGAPSVMSSIEYDSAPPLNINDSDLLPNAQQLPVSQPSTVFTDTTFLHCSMQSAPLRIRLSALTNSIHRSLDFQETLKLEQEVQQGLEEIPRWSNEDALQVWTLLDLQLRQFLAILHTPRTLQPQNRLQPDHRYSILTCLEASADMIEKHTAIIDCGNFSLCCIRSDYYRAAFLICHIAYHAANASDRIVKRVAKTIFDSAITQALRLQEERAMRPGRGSHQYWYIDAACSLVGIKFEPSRTEILKRLAVDRLSRLLYRILSLQDDPCQTYLATEVMLTEGFSTDENRTGPAAGAMENMPQPDSFSNNAHALSLGGFDFGNSSEWVLDDFWFSSDIPPLP